MFINLGTTNKKVLIIDDDDSLRRLVHVRLERHEKINVLQAADGDTGIAKAQADMPNLVILDWMLPDISGTKVLRHLKAENKTKDIPVLMLTGRNKVGDIEDAFKYGADGYLTKPFSLTKLGEKVVELLA